MPDGLYVVGIGASAGGLDAVQQFFANLPERTGISFILVQHLSPDFKSLMPELLSKHTKLKIFTASEGQIIEPDCIYLNQRSKNLVLNGGRLHMVDKAQKDHLNLPIDILFHSLGEEYRERAIGVILSGTGSDGSRGIKTIKEAGGTILVQDPETAQFNGMPNSAIYTNLPDFILPPQGIAERIVQFTSRRVEIKAELSSESEADIIFKEILTEIHNYTGVNFKKYKNNTLLRRLEKRMTLHNIDSLGEYLTFLKNSQKEKAALKQEFLIGVTSFFRDKGAFEILKNRVIPEICLGKKKNETVRIWTPGCSSGEEAYSIAILFDRYIRDNKIGLDYKIFATDIDKNALQRAGYGYYPVNNFIEIDNEYLDDYFFKTGEQIQIIKRIREKIVFSQHDVTSDPPFIRMDLVTCRNLLIYFTTATQRAVIDNFQYALNKNGFLFLGSSESIGAGSSNFKIVDTKWKIFQNLTENFRSLPTGERDDSFQARRIDFLQDSTTGKVKHQTHAKIGEFDYYRLLSKKHAPVSVFTDSEFVVRFIQGNIKRWIISTDGMFENNLLNMLNDELSVIVRNGIKEAEERGNRVSIFNLEVSCGEEVVATNLHFEIVNDLDTAEKIYLIQFSETSKESGEDKIVLRESDLVNFSRQRITDLELELKEKRAELQNVIEELETSNEELQSSNEELMSSNEELQSSNEELQSVNEELYTVNSEFQEKNKELENLNNDMSNLLNSSDVGTLFLDKDLNIRKFTPQIKRIFNLEESDIGRSIIGFASEFPDSVRQSIIIDSKEALEHFNSFEKEVQDNQGNWYLKRIKPFITSDKKIDGVIITLVDINKLKKTRSELIESDIRLSQALEAGNMAWWEVELPSGSVRFNENKTRMIGRNREDFTHYSHFMAIVHPDDYNKTMEAFRDHLAGKRDMYEAQYRMQNINGEYQWFQDVGRIVSKVDNKVFLAGIVVEITNKKNIELQLLEAIKRAETANIYKNQFLANMSHEIRTPMNGIVGFASLLRDDNLDAHTRDSYISIIENSSNQLLSLLNDIIDLSKIEAGELSIQLTTCRLSSLFIEIETFFTELKRRKGKDHLKITANIPNNLTDMIIKTDPVRLQQVIVNLVGNSMKFTETGGVDFGFTAENESVTLYVQDTGIGMPQDKLELIFERFQRLEHKDRAKYDGTGLGLAITRGIVHLLGGDIIVESQLDKGTCFKITLPGVIVNPYDISKERREKPNLNVNKQSITLLVAEDEMVNTLYLTEIFRKMDVNVLWAENGEEAVNLYKNNNIDIVLMDIRMPKMDGYEAARKILEIDPKARIIAQTAYAMSGDRENFLAMGFKDYISKPIKKDALIEKIAANVPD